jgi:hypothetical protein
MRDEVVTRRRWMTTADFLDLLSATNLLPAEGDCPLLPALFRYFVSR